MIYVGIDPGVAGGIAAIRADGHVLDVWKMPHTDPDVLDVFLEIADAASGPTVFDRKPIHAVLEHVHAGVFGFSRKGEDKSEQRMGVVSAFTFGEGIGRLKMALTAVDIPFEEVAPVTWQNFMGCRSRGDKNVTKARAQQIFPDWKITHAIADALLMADYCRRLHGGKLRPLPPPIPLQSSNEGRDSGSYGKESKGGKEEGREEEGGQGAADRAAGARKPARRTRRVSGF